MEKDELHSLFCNSLICNEKINDICRIKFNSKISKCYRGIKHGTDSELTDEDFLPTIMERNGNHMSSFDIQLNYKVDAFSVSLNVDLVLLKEFVKSFPSLRRKIVSYAEGFISTKKGLVSEPDESGHFLYFLFDPVLKNPVSDFHFVEEEKGRELYE